MTTPEEEYRIIPLTKGQVTLVSLCDYGWLNQWKWYAIEMKPGYFQAARFVRINGKKVCLYMHRVIVGLSYGDKRKVDHKMPSCTLDNRRSNLRIATQSQNGMNRGKQRNNKSGFKGVSWDKRAGKWASQITKAGRRYFLGYYARAEDAHAAYCSAALKLHSDFARTT